MAKTAKLGETIVDISKIVRDPRGIEDMIIDAIEADFQEVRFLQFNQRLFPFADAADIAEWDSFLTERYPPAYMSQVAECNDCPLGPCDLKTGAGNCGLTNEAYQARLSLRFACRGCLSQVMDTRELLNYALKLYGKEQAVEWGKLHDRSDTSHIGLMTGMWPRNLDDLNRALSYVEEQMAKLLSASFTGLDPVELEQMVFHAGSILLVAMDVSELIKMNCFGFTNASNQDITALIDWPPVNVLGGIGNVEPGKPVVTFIGDNFLTAWLFVKHLEKEGLTEQVEVCGIGAVAHDIIRFYERGRVLGPMVQARKLIRYGISDLIVASPACMSMDFVTDARRTETKIIWVGKDRNIGLPDYIDVSIEKIVDELVTGGTGAWIRDVEKAAEVTIRVINKINRKKDYLPSEEAVKEEARRCKIDCDLCVGVCPNGLLIGPSIRKVQDEGLCSLSKIEEGCYFCGKCEEICPEKIPVTDLLLANLGNKADCDRFKMRAGRGPVPRVETTAWAMGTAWGNCPGIYHIIGCGDARHREDLGWIAYQLASRNAIIFTAGCGAGEVARYFNEEKQKYLMEEFGAEAQVRNILNCGSCTACAHIVDQAVKWSRTGSGISHYANYTETVDVYFNLVAPCLIVWGALPERMYALVAAWVRAGMCAIVGPDSAFGWKRYLMGNKWQWENWWTYLTHGGEKRIVEPAPPGMIIPVETKEEAVVKAFPAVVRPADIRDVRQTRLDCYVELHDKFYHEFPDDWHLYARSDWELPFRYKSRLLKELKEKHGWEIDRLQVKKAKHPDGRLVDISKFKDEYSAMTLHVTKVPRLILSKEGE